MRRKFGFTLAEVLITLGIIGVVAALTMPVLYAHIKDIILVNQNKKAQMVLANGTRMLMARYDLVSLQGSDILECKGEKACIKTEIGKFFKVAKDNITEDSIFDKEYKFTSGNKTVWQDSSMKYVFLTADGMIFGLIPDYDTNSINVIGDINGIKDPNEGGKDLCLYSISNTGTLSEKCSDMENWAPTDICDIDHLDKCSQSECEALPINGHEEYYYDTTQGKCNARYVGGGSSD